MDNRGVFDHELEEWKQTYRTPRYKYKVGYFKKVLNRHIKNWHSILELGCGISPYLEDFSECDKYAVDTSESLLKLNKDKKTSFYRLSATELPDEWKNKFDVIYCAGLVHHVKNHDLLLQKIHLCLKQGGLFVFIEPSSTSLTGLYYHTRALVQDILSKRFITKFAMFFDEDEKYIPYFRFKKLLETKGFKKIEYHTIQLLRFPPLKILERINIEGINNKFERFRAPFGTTLVGVFRKN
jgi:SAM-dependent methyltransferase